MRLEFYIGPETDVPHIFQHGVTEEEVAEVLEKPAETRLGEGGTLVSIGQTSGGRTLRVVYRPWDDDALFVITAYDVVGKPLRAFKRRMRKRNA